MSITFIKADKLKQKPDKVFGFGKTFTDYMYVREFGPDGKWGEGTIRPFDAVELLPCSSVLHYGQAAFEGLKAYRNEKGEVRLFRARDNFMRMRKARTRLDPDGARHEPVYPSRSVRRRAVAWRACG